MTEEVHRIWRYAPVLMEEHLAYEDGCLWPDQVGEISPLDLPGEKTRFECECGKDSTVGVMRSSTSRR